MKHMAKMKASSGIKLQRNSSQATGKSAYETFQARPTTTSRNEQPGFLSRTTSTGKGILFRQKRDSSTGFNRTQKTAMASSIYELVTTQVKVPDGLMYRGKYCGKSKLRQRMLEQSKSNTNVAAAASTTSKPLEDMLSSVVPRHETHHTDKPRSRKFDTQIPLKGKDSDSNYDDRS